MKKLLVLALVLSVAGLANAGLKIASDKDVIDYTKDEMANISVSVAGGNNVFGYTIAVSVQGPGALDGSGVTFPTVFFLAGAVQKDTPEQFEATASELFGAAKEGPSVLVDNLMLKGLGKGVVTLSLIADAGTTVNGELVQRGFVFDTIDVNVIPEPMTMALLGLGGLFLRRRK